jgi:hypothetical protein
MAGIRCCSYGFWLLLGRVVGKARGNVTLPGASPDRAQTKGLLYPLNQLILPL